MVKDGLCTSGLVVEDIEDEVWAYLRIRRAKARCSCDAFQTKMNKRIRVFAQKQVDPPGHRSCAPLMAHGPYPELKVCCWVCCDCEILRMLEDVTL